MNKNKKIIIAIIVVVVMLFVAIFALRVWGTYMWQKEITSSAPNIDDRRWDTRSGVDQNIPPGEADKHPFLDYFEEKGLESVGIDPSKLPNTITPELQACLEKAVGYERYLEIKGGSYPTMNEVLLGLPCLDEYKSR